MCFYFILYNTDYIYIVYVTTRRDSELYNVNSFNPLLMSIDPLPPYFYVPPKKN